MFRLSALTIVSVLTLSLLICNYNINAEIVTTVTTPSSPIATYTVTTTQLSPTATYTVTVEPLPSVTFTVTVQPPPRVTVTTPPEPSVTYTVITPTVPELTPLIHYVFYVGARDFTRYDFEACSGCGVSIVFYVYEAGTQTASDIIFRVITPDGREVYPRTKIYSRLSWSFTAEQGGRYTLEFDNTYSLLTTKRIDLAIVIIPPPTTIRETTTIYTTTTAYTTATITPPGSGISPEPGLIALVGVIALIIGLVIGIIIRRPKPSTKT